MFASPSTQVIQSALNGLSIMNPDERRKSYTNTENLFEFSETNVVHTIAPFLPLPNESGVKVDLTIMRSPKPDACKINELLDFRTAERKVERSRPSCGEYSVPLESTACIFGCMVLLTLKPHPTKYCFCFCWTQPTTCNATRLLKLGSTQKSRRERINTKLSKTDELYSSSS